MTPPRPEARGAGALIERAKAGQGRRDVATVVRHYEAELARVWAMLRDYEELAPDTQPESAPSTPCDSERGREFGI